jgi:putative ubiquitin-RnfH superfamily antitoxin RatB of RatAB toxin-antitoxin module
MASDPGKQTIRVEVAYAVPERQVLLALDVHAGCTVAEAIELSGIRQEFPEMLVDSDAVGIFSKKVGLNHPLDEGDRVEIYRPLVADPKESRRKRAAAGKGEPKQ